MNTKPLPRSNFNMNFYNDTLIGATSTMHLSARHMAVDTSYDISLPSMSL